MNLKDKLAGFNPNGVGNTSGALFGLPFDTEESRVVCIPMTWDATVSNHEGTWKAPELILCHSSQIDLYDPFSTDAWKQGIAMEAIDKQMMASNKNNRILARQIISYLESGGNPETNAAISEMVDRVNASCNEVCVSLETKCLKLLNNKQIPIVIGGDHGTSLGLVRAIAAKRPGTGILQIDAHADLRYRYQGFTHSHASVMRNAIETPGVSALVQVGLRELCDEEAGYIENNPSIIFPWFDRDIHQQLFHRSAWSDICNDIIDTLPEFVYVSFDVDGLEPALCPASGTPVPGGLTYNQAMYLLETLVKSGRKIVGADLVETGAADYDATIACRILYRLATLAIMSNN